MRKNVVTTINDEPERKTGWYARCAALLFTPLEESSSPYINRFLSADTIVPGFANPQNLNRYAYVANNPLRYTDPTGHMRDEGNAGTRGGVNCNKTPQYCNGNRPKTSKELAAMRPKPPAKNVSSTPPATPTATTTPAPSFTPGINLQITLPTQPCTSNPCISNLVPSATPSSTSTPLPLMSNENLQEGIQYVVPSNPLRPDFAPNADDIWDIIGGALPLVNMPATSLNQIVYNTVNMGINATRAISNALSNVGSAVNEAIGNGPYYGPVIPIFYIPSPEDLFPVSGPVYN